MRPKPGQPRLNPPANEHDHTQGPTDAPVTLVEYGDYECPHCGRAYPIVKDLQARMGDRLRFVYRNFPLTESHPYAEHAAEAAEAAGEQGDFWPMHDTLFEHQDALDDEHLVRYAAELGLDAREIAREIEDGAHVARIRADFMSGVRSGVNGTPTFFINLVRFDGAWDNVGAFLAALEEAATSGARSE
ncbi:MAG TPA: thioredoxin domain-containing protein [Gemmatimonadaceae bacterium]|jgi:protein-disulfide isomerase|nr:thioredoxin domain-containing protein [Gemmatimonadaceae bacterium]